MSLIDIKAIKAAVAAQKQNPESVADQADGPDVFTVLTTDEMDEMAPPQWLVEGILGKGHISCIYGQSASLKSFIAIDIAMSIGSGDIDWHGRKTEHGFVLYVAAEGAAGLGKRCHAWRQHHRTLGQHDLFRLLPRCVNLLDVGEVDKLIRTINGLQVKIGTKLSLLTIDTLAKSAPGGDEDKARDMGLILRAAERIRDAIGCCVLFIHHTGKDTSRGARGSYSLKCGVDSLIEAERVQKSMTVALTIEKQKDDADGAMIELGAKEVEWHRAGCGTLKSLVMTDASELPPDSMMLADRRQIAGLIKPGCRASVSQLMQDMALPRCQGSYARFERAIAREPDFTIVRTVDGDRKLWRGSGSARAERTVHCEAVEVQK